MHSSLSYACEEESADEEFSVYIIKFKAQKTLDAIHLGSHCLKTTMHTANVIYLWWAKKKNRAFYVNISMFNLGIFHGFGKKYNLLDKLIEF